MIKKLLSSKVTSAASTQFVVFGLKMLDSHTLRFAGILLCAASLVVLFFGWQHSAKAEQAATVPTTRHTRKSTQPRVSRRAR